MTSRTGRKTKIPTCTSFYSLKAKSSVFSWKDLLSIKANRTILINNIERFLDDGVVPDEIWGLLDEDEKESIKARFEATRSQVTSDKWSDMLRANPPRGWNGLFDDYLLGEIDSIQHILEDKAIEITPAPSNIFRAYRLTPLHNVKVVIIGQNPYHQVNSFGEKVANGLAFSTVVGFKVQPSLKTIYQMAARKLEEFVIPEHGDLSVWAKRGVLLLNTSLTSEIGNPKNVMGKMWEKVIERTLEAVYQNNPDTVFVLWGRDAEECPLPNGGSVIKVVANHPSPMSDTNKFIEAASFVKVNELLVSKGISPIDWTIPSSMRLEAEYESLKLKQENFDKGVLEALNVEYME